MSGRILHGREVDADVVVDCDVCIIGSGAGGAVLAAGLTAQGARVVMLEEGGSFTKADFDLVEAHAYPMLYQGRGGRATADQAISVLQGRSVGGSTTVNWTTCFRTPERILSHWQRVHGVEGFGPEDLRPHFEAVEERLGIAPWEEARANPNNRLLLEGARSLGYGAEVIRRNVRGCGNTGYCGLGCPIDAKQAMHVTYIPDAVAAGLTLYADTRAERIVTEGRRVTSIEGRVLDRATGRPTGRTVTVRPKVAVSSAGAINGPALLLRSGLDHAGRVGRRTFLHPVVALPALYEQHINAYEGAPQSIASHHFVDRGPDKVGFFLEVPPLQPMLTATGALIFGADHHRWMRELSRVGAMLAITVDGLLPGDEGGTVSLRDDGRVKIDYPIGEPLEEAFHAAHKVLAAVTVAAGALHSRSSHIDPVIVETVADIAAYDRAPWGAHEHAIFTAHQMGGCPMGADPERSVVDSQLRYRGVDNLFVVDGSVLPTSLGVNPSETIYGIAHRSLAFVAGAL